MLMGGLAAHAAPSGPGSLYGPVPAPAPAIGAAEAGHRVRPGVGQALGQPAPLRLAGCEDQRPDHVRPHGEVVDVPAQRLMPEPLPVQIDPFGGACSWLVDTGPVT